MYYENFQDINQAILREKQLKRWSRAKKDYLINLKSELEIRVLHEKIDHLILKQQQELFEIQQEQIQLLGNIWKKLEDKK